MIRHKSFIFKLKPDGATRRSLAKACGCVRFVYNKGLDWNKEQREKDQTFRVSYPKLCALLPEWKGSCALFYFGLHHDTGSATWKTLYFRTQCSFGLSDDSVELPQTGPEIAAHLLGGRPYGHQVLIREDGAAVFRQVEPPAEGVHILPRQQP